MVNNFSLKIAVFGIIYSNLKYRNLIEMLNKSLRNKTNIETDMEVF